MLTPDTPLEPLSDQPTRQQLDELDALMQRMLALPVNPVEEENAAPEISEAVMPASAPPASGWKPHLPVWPGLESSEAPARSAMSPALPEASSPGHTRPLVMEETLAEPGRPTSSQSEPVEPPVFEDFRFDAPPVRRPLVVKQELPTIKEEDPLAPAAELVIVAPRMIASWWLQPFLWCNRAYDRTTELLGPLGQTLRGEPTRNWLGWTGVALLMAAVTWVAVEGFGWIW